jgi:hypothetical protein
MPPRNAQQATAMNPYAKPSFNFKTVNTGDRATVIRIVPSAV